MPEYKYNTYLQNYAIMKNKALLEGNLTGTSINLETAIEWDRIRLLINPNARLSPPQLKLGLIPEDWRSN